MEAWVSVGCLLHRLPEPHWPVAVLVLPNPPLLLLLLVCMLEFFSIHTAASSFVIPAISSAHEFLIFLSAPSLPQPPDTTSTFMLHSFSSHATTKADFPAHFNTCSLSLSCSYLKGDTPRVKLWANSTLPLFLSPRHSSESLL